MKKFVSLFLVFSILTLSGNLYAKKKGAEIVIQKKDGQKVRGELIAVKEDSVLLVMSDTPWSDMSGTDVSIDISAIKVITIKKESKFLSGAGFGLLIGGGGGALLGYALGSREGEASWGPAYGAMALGMLGGLFGLIIGGITGATSGKSRTIQVEGRSDAEIVGLKEYLRSKARIPDYK